MKFSSTDDARKFERDMPWEDREKPVTLYQMLRQTRDKHPNHKAMSFQLTSGASDPAQTLTWSQFHDQVWQAANLFRDLGIGEQDVVAFILPNCLETAVAMIGGMVAGIANPINPLLEPDQIANACVEAIRAETFLVLPHPGVLDYMRHKTADYDRWIGGMRKLNRLYSN